MNETAAGEIMNLSSGEKSASDRTCAMFESSEACECTTPLGLPSDPEVNNTTAASSGRWPEFGRLENSARPRTHSLSTSPRRPFISSR